MLFQACFTCDSAHLPTGLIATSIQFCFLLRHPFNHKPALLSFVFLDKKASFWIHQSLVIIGILLYVLSNVFRLLCFPLSPLICHSLEDMHNFLNNQLPFTTTIIPFPLATINGPACRRSDILRFVSRQQYSINYSLVALSKGLKNLNF